jgi:Diacylglycerol kinase accessory domain
METGKIIFTTNKKDKEYNHIKGNPICFVAPNISSYAGGNCNLWRNSYNMNGLKNPYTKKQAGVKKEAMKM